MTLPLSRRDFFKFSAAGAAGRIDLGLVRPLAAAGRRSASPHQGVHPAVDGRRPQPQGHLRPEARHRARRPLSKPIETSVPGIQISEHFPKFAKLDAARRHHPRHEHRRRRPRPGQLLPAHRLQRRRRAAGLPERSAPSSRRDWASPTSRCRTSSSIGNRSYGSGFLGPKPPAAASSTTRPAASRTCAPPWPDNQFDSRVGLLEELEKRLPHAVPGRRRHRPPARPTTAPSS